jgi:hypothetical protein
MSIDDLKTIQFTAQPPPNEVSMPIYIDEIPPDVRAIARDTSPGANEVIADWLEERGDFDRATSIRSGGSKHWLSLLGMWSHSSKSAIYIDGALIDAHLSDLSLQSNDRPLCSANGQLAGVTKGTPTIDVVIAGITPQVEYTAIVDVVCNGSAYRLHPHAIEHQVDPQNSVTLRIQGFVEIERVCMPIENESMATACGKTLDRIGAIYGLVRTSLAVSQDIGVGLETDAELRERVMRTIRLRG